MAARASDCLRMPLSGGVDDSGVGAPIVTRSASSTRPPPGTLPAEAAPSPEGLAVSHAAVDGAAAAVVQRQGRAPVGRISAGCCHRGGVTGRTRGAVSAMSCRFDCGTQQCDRRLLGGRATVKALFENL